jgi:hypothetical protein
MSRTRSALSLVLLLSASAACSDSSGPSGGTFTGRYTLVQVNGVPLPFVVSAGLLGPTRVLVGGSLTVQGNGRVLDARNFHLGPVTTNAPTEADSTTYAYSQRNNLLEIQRPRINPALSHVDTGRVDGDRITVFVRYAAPQESAPIRATFLYERAR